jgi:hypothetical protein
VFCTQVTWTCRLCLHLNVLFASCLNKPHIFLLFQYEDSRFIRATFDDYVFIFNQQIFFIVSPLYLCYVFFSAEIIGSLLYWDNVEPDWGFNSGFPTSDLLYGEGMSNVFVYRIKKKAALHVYISKLAFLFFLNHFSEDLLVDKRLRIPWAHFLKSWKCGAAVHAASSRWITFSTELSRSLN